MNIFNDELTLLEQSEICQCLVALHEWPSDPAGKASALRASATCLPSWYKLLPPACFPDQRPWLKFLEHDASEYLSVQPTTAQFLYYTIKIKMAAK